MLLALLSPCQCKTSTIEYLFHSPFVRFREYVLYSLILVLVSAALLTVTIADGSYMVEAYLRWYNCESFFDDVTQSIDVPNPLTLARVLDTPSTNVFSSVLSNKRCLPSIKPSIVNAMCPCAFPTHTDCSYESTYGFCSSLFPPSSTHAMAHWYLVCWSLCFSHLFVKISCTYKEVGPANPLRSLYARYSYRNSARINLP